MPPDSEKVFTSDSDLDFENNLNKHEKQGQTGAYICNFENCGLRFKRKVKLDRHEYSHTGVRKHVCTFEGCSKSYTISTHLKRHIKVVHEHFIQEKTIECPLDNCNKKFDSVSYMEKHVKEFHENPKIYPCPNCSNEFKRKIQLKRHMVTHTGEYPFKCDKCQKGFVLQTLYRKHSCHQKTYKCESCEKEFLKWSLLVAHRKNDHVIAYKCEICGKELKRKEYLKAHLESHKNIGDKQILECPWHNCNRFYYHIRNLKSHIRAKHEGFKYKCCIDGCDKELASRQKLEYHIRMHEIQPGTSKQKGSQKDKKNRSDKGKKKKSYASILSGVVLDRGVEKMLLNGKGKEIEVVAPDTDRQTDTDDDIPLAKRIHLLIQT